MSSVAVCVPSIPPRASMLAEALTSVAMQTRPVDQVVVCVDHERHGAPRTLARCFAAVDCDYVVFLGDDDWLEPTHIEKTLAAAEASGADVTYPWYVVEGGTDPRPWVFQADFRPEMVNEIAGGGALIRTEAIRAAGGLPTPEIGPGSTVSGEDFALWNRLHEHGARFVHVPERLYHWRHHSGNTSGLPRW